MRTVLLRWFPYALVLAVAPLQSGCTLFSGCGAATEEALPIVDEQEAQATAKDLNGAYQQVAAGGRYPGLVLARKADGTQVFFTEVAAGCPSPMRVEGTWNSSRTNLNLYSKAQGRQSYRYTLAEGKLTLWDANGATAAAVLGRAGSFCTRSSDCSLQSFVHIMCVGQAVCTAGRTCGWSCGAAKPGYGDTCGGIAALQCGTGMRCSLEDPRGCSAPVHPDISGVCRAAATDPCQGYRCVTGEHCVAEEGEASCQPDSQDLCPRVRCIGSQPHCVEWAETKESACLPEDQCHRDADCKEGKRCQPAKVCVRAPCFAELVCR